MKLFTTLFLSLIMAGLICLFLMGQDILKPVAGTMPDAVIPEVHRILARLVDALAEPSRTKQVLPQAESRFITRNDPAGPTGRATNATYHKILTYLSTNAGQSEFEAHLRDYIEQDCRLDPLTTEKYLRMILWKNFITLQRAWQPGEGEDLRAAFAREKALKQAGFAARGLALMDIELTLAETRLREMLSSLAPDQKQEDKA